MGGRPVLYLPRAVRRTRVDEVQSQLLPQVHHASVSDEPIDESSPVSVLQAARAFGRAHATTKRGRLRHELTRRGGNKFNITVQYITSRLRKSISPAGPRASPRAGPH